MTDLRLALRLCLRHPVLSLAAIFSLALGIGANTAIFTVLNGSVLRPLPYADPDQLMVVWETRADNPRRAVAPANFIDWRRETHGSAPSRAAASGLAAFDDFSATLDRPGEAQRVRAVSASANFFEVLGVQAQIGRVMTRGRRSRRARAGRGADRRLVASPLRRRRQCDRPDARSSTASPSPSSACCRAAFDMPMVAGAEVWMTGDRGIPRSFPFTGDLTAVRDSHIIAVIGRLAPGSIARAGAGAADERDDGAVAALSVDQCGPRRERDAAARRDRRRHPAAGRCCCRSRSRCCC